MSARQDLFSHLSANVPLADGRVYPLMMPQDTEFPALVYAVVSDIDHGYMLCDDGNSTRWQVDCYAESYADAVATMEETKAALYGFAKFPHDLDTQEMYEKDTGLFRQMIDFATKG